MCLCGVLYRRVVIMLSLSAVTSSRCKASTTTPPKFCLVGKFFPVRKIENFLSRVQNLELKIRNCVDFKVEIKILSTRIFSV